MKRTLSQIRKKVMFEINYIKTLYYNYKFFGLKGLKRLPIIIHRNVIFKDAQGSIMYHGELKRGVIRIGSVDCLATKDMKFDRTIIDLSGTLDVEGSVHIAPGSRISIDSGAILKLADGFNTTGNVTIICNKRIQFGVNCLISWDVQIMDADLHGIFDGNEAV